MRVQLQPVAGAPGEAGSLRSRFCVERGDEVWCAHPSQNRERTPAPEPRAHTVPEPRAQRVGFARSASDGPWVAKREPDAGARAPGDACSTRAPATQRSAYLRPRSYARRRV